MRLIDADALRIVTRGKNHHRKYVYADITDAPTIDAIPVEWLEQRRFETSFHGAEPDIDLNYAFGTVMNEWQQEQEAIN